MKEGSLDGALSDTQHLISQSDAPEKALYRASEALYDLGRFAECQDLLKKLKSRFPGNVEAMKNLERVHQRLNEEQNGEYDFKLMNIEASQKRPPFLDHATFVGPVTVKTSTVGGRGLFTTRAVKAGELLFCEKSFACCYANTAEDNSGAGAKISLLMNTHTDRMTLGTQGDLITVIVQKLQQNPSLMPRFTELHHGSYEPVAASQVDGQPVIDTYVNLAPRLQILTQKALSFLVERIISLNVFGCPLTSRESHLRTSDKDKSAHHSCGIWLLASLINHSCRSNVRRSFIGDMQIVRATQDIPADMEVTFWYRMPDGGEYEETQKGLQHWGFECACEICLDAKSTPKKLMKRRKALLIDLKSFLQGPGEPDVAQIERILTAIGRTYQKPAREVPQIAIWDKYLFLAQAYAARQEAIKVVSMALKALECLGFVIEGADILDSSGRPLRVLKWGIMMDGVIQAWIHLGNVYAAFKPQLEDKAKEYAKISYRICVGEDVTFEESHGEHAPASSNS